MRMKNLNLPLVSRFIPGRVRPLAVNPFRPNRNGSPLGMAPKPERRAAPLAGGDGAQTGTLRKAAGGNVGLSTAKGYRPFRNGVIAQNGTPSQAMEAA